MDPVDPIKTQYDLYEDNIDLRLNYQLYVIYDDNCRIHHQLKQLQCLDDYMVNELPKKLFSHCLQQQIEKQFPMDESLINVLVIPVDEKRHQIYMFSCV